ncbi:MAG TPA: CocE/NonD family hydrolase [Actinomycetota bacterium]|nr:CocE/NonD family hydrolase [Actinomycetota bacterium]
MGERRSWIPMEDGVRLAVSLFLPEGAEEGRAAPAVLEALPYRKDDATASYRPEYERLCGEYGYAVARVDLRGTGSSEGVATDEYPASEQADLCQVIAWLAAQPWSTGAVGMYGTSYSGFNSLQVAAERPPALKAVVAIYASDDRYTDDVHYTGGVLKLLDLVDYPLYMVALNALPPVPAIAGPDWRERWRARVEGLEPWLLRWLEEQADGPYWRQGSLRPAYERIACPTMLVAGWADGYRNATFRMLERLRAPARLLFGPWSHMDPDISLPGPRIDLVPEMVRWWDRWLRGRRNGVDEAPPVTVFVRHATRPAPDLDELAGSWRDEPVWPPERARSLILPLSGAAPASEGVDRLAVRADVGSAAWISCAGHLPFGQPDDQRSDDAWSLVYDWELDEELEILGHPRLAVRVGSSAPVAFLSAKLCDVFPDGTSALVARGFLNLAQRRSRTDPEPMRPGVVEAVELELDATSWVFPAGHRLRLSLAGTDWPNLVPPPAPVTLTVERDGSALTLPALDGPSPSPPPSLSPPRPADRQASTPNPLGGGRTMSPQDPQSTGGLGMSPPDPPTRWRVVRDVLGRGTEAEIDHGGRTELPDGAVLVERYQGTVGTALDPGPTWARGSASYRVQWPEATVATGVRLDLRGDADAYEVQLDLEAREGDELRWARTWHRRIPRHLS